MVVISRRDKHIPERKWVDPGLWKKIIESVPLACVDILFEQDDSALLYGYRRIPPYRDMWALVGGRILHGEDLQRTVQRIASEYGVRFESLYQVGVFPVRFRSRADVTIALAATNSTGKPKPDGKEFSQLLWATTPPGTLAINYRRMVEKWQKARNEKSFLDLNKII